MNFIGAVTEQKTAPHITWRNIVKAGPVPKSLSATRAVAKEAITESTIRVVRLAYSVSHSLPELWKYYEKIIGSEFITPEIRSGLESTIGFAKNLKTIDRSKWVPLVNEFASVVYNILNDLENMLLDTMQIIVQNTISCWELLKQDVKAWAYSWYLTMYNIQIFNEQRPIETRDFVTSLSLLFADQSKKTADLLRNQNVDLKQTNAYKAMQQFTDAPKDEVETDVTQLITQLEWNAVLLSICPRATHAWSCVFFNSMTRIFTQWFGNELIHTFHELEKWGPSAKTAVNIQAGVENLQQHNSEDVDLIEVVMDYTKKIAEGVRAYQSEPLDNVISDLITAGKLLNQDIDDFDWDAFKNLIHRKTGFPVEELAMLQRNLEDLVLDAQIRMHQKKRTQKIGPRVITDGNEEDNNSTEEEEKEKSDSIPDPTAALNDEELQEEELDQKIIDSGSMEKLRQRIKQVKNFLRLAQIRHTRRQNFIESAEGRDVIRQGATSVLQNTLEGPSASLGMGDAEEMELSEAQLDRLTNDSIQHSFVRERIEWHQKRLEKLQKAFDWKRFKHTTFKYVIFGLMLALFGLYLMKMFFSTNEMLPQVDNLRNILEDQNGNIFTRNAKLYNVVPIQSPNPEMFEVFNNPMSPNTTQVSFEMYNERRIEWYENVARVLWPTNSTVSLWQTHRTEFDDAFGRLFPEQPGTKPGWFSFITDALNDATIGIATSVSTGLGNAISKMNEYALSSLPAYRESYNVEILWTKPWLYELALRAYNLRDATIGLFGVSILHTTFMPILSAVIDPFFTDIRPDDRRFQSTIVVFGRSVLSITKMDMKLVSYAVGTYIAAEAFRQGLRVVGTAITVSIVAGTSTGALKLLSYALPSFGRLTNSIYQGIFTLREPTREELESKAEDTETQMLLTLDRSKIPDYVKRVRETLRLTQGENVPSPIEQPMNFYAQAETLRLAIGRDNLTIQEARDAVRTITAGPQDEPRKNIPVTKEQSLLALKQAEEEEDENAIAFHGWFGRSEEEEDEEEEEEDDVELF